MSVTQIISQESVMPASQTADDKLQQGSILPSLDGFLATGGETVLSTGVWGLEREVMRTEADGQPARTRHPYPNEEKQISVDFAENQAELVTQPHTNPVSALRELARLQSRLQQAIGDELLWPLSLPGRWDAPERVQAASFEGRPEWEAQRA